MHMTRKKQPLLQKASILFVILVLLAAFIFQFYRVNAKYPPPTLVEHQLGESFQHQEVEMTVLDFQLFEFDDFMRRYAIDPKDTDLVVANSGQKNAVVTVHFQNKQDHVVEISTAEMMLLQTEGWTGYIDLMDLFFAMNPDMSPTIRLRPGSEVTFYFGYSLYEMHFSKKAYAELFELPFQIVLQIYPVKNVIRLT